MATTLDDNVFKTRVISKDGTVKKATNQYIQCRKQLEQDGADIGEIETQVFALQTSLHIQLAAIRQTAGLVATLDGEEAHIAENQQAVETRIGEVEAEIVALKEELAREKQLRQNKEEYENMKRLINQVESREATTAAKQIIEDAIAILEQESQALDKQVQTRAKQFSLFSRALSELQRDLQEETATRDTMQSPPTIMKNGDVAMKDV